MFLVIATMIWVALALLVPYLPRRWWQQPTVALIVTAPVLMILTGQEMGTNVAGLMAVAMLLLIRNPMGGASAAQTREVTE